MASPRGPASGALTVGDARRSRPGATARDTGYYVWLMATASSMWLAKTASPRGQASGALTVGDARRSRPGARTRDTGYYVWLMAISMTVMTGALLMITAGMASGPSLFGLHGGDPPGGGGPQISYGAGLAGCESGAFHRTLDFEYSHVCRPLRISAKFF